MNGTEVQKVKQVIQALESNEQPSLDWSPNSGSLIPASHQVPAKSGFDGVRSQTLKDPV